MENYSGGNKIISADKTQVTYLNIKLILPNRQAHNFAKK
jgi:hypothetical protein